MSKLSDMIEELVQASYYRGLYTGKREYGEKLRGATRRQVELQAEVHRTIADLRAQIAGLETDLGL